MGTYVVTGGSKGIGAATVKILQECGHHVMNVDKVGGDINADLGTKEGREDVVTRIHQLFPEGLDGLVSNAGIASSEPFSRVLSVNYFGSVALMEGLYDLLKLKKGRCVATVSGSIAYGPRDSIYYVDNLLVNCGDEERIGRLVDSFDPALVDNAIYGSTKIALVRWIRRTAPSWARNGVNLNGLAPGGVATSLMDGVKHAGGDIKKLSAFAMPLVQDRDKLMHVDEIAPALAFLVQPGAVGTCGDILYCDGGTSALFDPEKFY